MTVRTGRADGHADVAMCSRAALPRVSVRGLGARTQAGWGGVRRRSTFDVKHSTSRSTYFLPLSDITIIVI